MASVGRLYTGTLVRPKVAAAGLALERPTVIPRVPAIFAESNPEASENFTLVSLTRDLALARS
jgi:hypothetical protein